MSMRVLGTLAALMLLTTSALAAPPDFAGMKIQPYDSPKPAPTLVLPNLDDKTVRLEDFKGKVVMLVFWATW